VINWASIIKAPTASEVFEQMLANAKALKFPTTSWGTKSVPRALMHLFSLVFESFASSTIVDLARSGFRTTAAGAWLTAHAKDFYKLDRVEAVFAVGTATLANASGDSYTYDPGTLFAKSTALDADGHELLFTNADAVAIGAGGTQTLSWRAEHAGSAYNVGGDTITELATPLPGVSISAAPATAWLTTVGADDEEDEDLSERCGERWDSLNLDNAGVAVLDDSYAYHAKSAAPGQVSRVLVLEHTPSDGHVTLVLSGPDGPVPSAVVTAVRAYLELGRRAMCVTLHVDSALAHLITLAGTVRVRAGYLAQARDEIRRALDALSAESGGGATIDLANLIRIVRAASGVTHVVLTAPLADVVLSTSEVATFLDTLTYVAA